jgi:hypothetical protein
MEEAMWQVRNALRRQRKVRGRAKGAAREELPRRWTELILRLNDMEDRSKAQEAQRPQERGGLAGRVLH